VDLLKYEGVLTDQQISKSFQ